MNEQNTYTASYSFIALLLGMGVRSSDPSADVCHLHPVIGDRCHFIRHEGFVRIGQRVACHVGGADGKGMVLRVPSVGIGGAFVCDVSLDADQDASLCLSVPDVQRRYGNEVRNVRAMNRGRGVCKPEAREERDESEGEGVAGVVLHNESIGGCGRKLPFSSVEMLDLELGARAVTERA